MENSLSLTKYWLENIVIGLDLCPFARIPFEEGRIRIIESAVLEEEEQLAVFLDELENLNISDPQEISTTLIVLPKANPDFLLFNDFVGDLEAMLEEVELDDVFQLVVFHPEFIFEETDFSDKGNLVNRSPYPIIQILRSEEIFKAIKNPKEGEAISFNNYKKLHALSDEALESLFYYLKK